MSPYTLPEGNVQIAFSGGRTSAYMLHHILEANGGLPDRAKVVFSNTGREMPETLDFVQEVSDRWSVPIVWVELERSAEVGQRYRVVSHNSAARDGGPFEDMIRAKKYLPNQGARFCTSELKVRPVRDYLVDFHGWKNWFSALGIRADEPQRVNREKQKERWQRWYPLADAGATKRHVSAFWKAQTFDLRLPNIKGNAALGNCDGCFLKSEATLSMLARDYPERHAWWEEMERLASSLTASPNGAVFRKDQPRAKLRDFVERQGDWIFDTEDALCQADGGECM